MSDDRVTIIERITFMDNGSSLHVWAFPDGTTREKLFSPSLVAVLLDGEYLDVRQALDQGLTRVERHVSSGPKS